MRLTVEDNNQIGMTVFDSDVIEAKTGDAVDIGTKSYDKLTDKPSIEGVTLEGEMSLSDIGAYTKSEINTQMAEKADTDDLATVATSGSYNDLSDKPTIPKYIDENSDKHTILEYGKTTVDGISGVNLTYETSGSDASVFLPDGDGFYTGSQAIIEQIPTKTSDLSNDSDFTTQEYVDEQDDDIRGRLFFGQVDATSTSTVFTATIDGITEYVDGLAVMLKNGIVTSASGFTIDINGLGAKQAYSNMASATAETTLFNINYTMLFVYDSQRVEGGGWVMYRGYNSNDNTIGYQIRSNSMSLPMKSVVYRYRLLFTSADGEGFVPANNSTSTNATAKRTPCQDKIDPFGRIVYYGTTTSVASGSRPGAAYLWDRYTLSLGYSFNGTGSALVLTTWKPVYLKCSPQADGSAIIDSTEPYVQAKPTTNDGFIYIHLGVAYSATNIELNLDHPVYYHDGTSVKLYTG